MKSLATKYASIFDKATDTKFFSPLCSNDCSIKLIDEKKIPFHNFYPLSNKEQDTLKEYIKTCLESKIIVRSSSPAGSPIFFVTKANGTLCPVVDYHDWKSNTVRNQYALPLIDGMLKQLSGATVFSKIDLYSTYNLIQMTKIYQQLTAFRCR
jgi:hypothetical protein